jgi:selenocysteine-specific elongation factor
MPTASEPSPPPAPAGQPPVHGSATPPRHFTVATAGHVDHGKSALVKALTGTDPDRLPEEKARGITIDLGFAHLHLADSAPAGAALDIGLVDVPGHEDFVNNMVAGSGSIDLALLVVSADDGWMPQTEEHLQILSYLGANRAVVVLTKIDLAEAHEALRTALIRQQLRGSPFEQAPIIPASVVTNRGLDDLRAALAQALAAAPPPRDVGKPRLPIDRAFSLPGIGTVVTGTLSGGCLHRGQEVILQPAGTPSRIRTIQTYNREIVSAAPGTRTALNLANVQPRAASQHGTRGQVVHRGCVVTLPGLGSARTIYDVLLERSPRLWAGNASTRPPLRAGARVRFCAASSNTPGRLYLSGRQQLCPGEHCLAQIRLEAPVYACVGDRFVIRDWPERLTLGGGVILDAGADKKTLRGSGWQHFAAGATPAPLSPQLAVKAQLQQHKVIGKTALLAQSVFSPAEIAHALSQSVAAGECAILNDAVINTADWASLRDSAISATDSWHQAHPEQAGIPLAELRSRLNSDLPGPEMWDALIADLQRTGFPQIGSVLKRSTHRPALPLNRLPAAARIRAALAAKPLEPPSRKELAPDAAAREALAFLLRASEVIELSPEILLSAPTFARANQAIRQFLVQHGPATVSELRQALGTSRRVMLPLLEKLDRDGTTIREGDKRRLKPSAR